MFVDASAIIAILTEEPEADALVDALDGARRPITSPIAVYEAVLGICRKRRLTVHEGQLGVRRFLETAGITVTPITDEECRGALDAFGRYGKGRGHPAQLNMGDCFAYAATKTHESVMLYKGDDFSRTDIRSALTEPHR